MTACSCKVGSIRIEVDGSKHDGIYNFLAKGLGDTIRCVSVGGVLIVLTVPGISLTRRWWELGERGSRYTRVVVDGLNVRSGYHEGVAMVMGGSDVSRWKAGVRRGRGRLHFTAMCWLLTFSVGTSVAHTGLFLFADFPFSFQLCLRSAPDCWYYGNLKQLQDSCKSPSV